MIKLPLILLNYNSKHLYISSALLLLIIIHKWGDNMPNKDGTGPKGEGPRTGRGLGNCGGQNTVRSQGRGLGRGRGNGQGRGLGRGNTTNQD